MTIPEKIQKRLQNKKRLQWFAAKFANEQEGFFVGRGIDYAISLEGSLKLKEISHIHSEVYAVGELKHGTISLIEPGTLVIGVLTQNDWIDTKMGRQKKKPEYDSEKIMEQFMNCIVDAYMSGTDGESVNSLRQISEQFSITLMKTRKILITAGVYHTELSDQVISLKESGKSISEIMQETGLSRSSVHSYLPYKKMIYNADELSLYAERCRLYRKRKQAVEKLHCCMNKSLELLETHLWETLKLFSGYSFMTVKGLRFHYTVNGNEILIDRKKKSITRSSVNIALKETLEMNGKVSGPKKLHVIGASYLYAIFLRFGLIKTEGE